jgi:hypothetical protein
MYIFLTGLTAGVHYPAAPYYAHTSSRSFRGVLYTASECVENSS